MIISHDSDFVWEIASHVVVLSEGRVLSEGPPQKIYSDKNVLETASLLCPNELDFILSNPLLTQEVFGDLAPNIVESALFEGLSKLTYNTQG